MDPQQLFQALQAALQSGDEVLAQQLLAQLQSIPVSQLDQAVPPPSQSILADRAAGAVRPGPAGYAPFNPGPQSSPGLAGLPGAPASDLSAKDLLSDTAIRPTPVSGPGLQVKMGQPIPMSDLSASAQAAREANARLATNVPEPLPPELQNVPVKGAPGAEGSGLPQGGRWMAGSKAGQPIRPATAAPKMAPPLPPAAMDIPLDKTPGMPGEPVPPGPYEASQAAAPKRVPLPRAGAQPIPPPEVLPGPAPASPAAASAPPAPVRPATAVPGPGPATRAGGWPADAVKPAGTYVGETPRVFQGGPTTPPEMLGVAEPTLVRGAPQSAGLLSRVASLPGVRPVIGLANRLSGPAAVIGMGAGALSDAFSIANAAKTDPLNSPLQNAGEYVKSALDAFRPQAQPGTIGSQTPIFRHIDPASVVMNSAQGLVNGAVAGGKALYDWATTAPGDGGMSVDPSVDPESVSSQLPPMSMPSEEAVNGGRPAEPVRPTPSKQAPRGAKGTGRGGQPAEAAPAAAESGPGYQRSPYSLGVPSLHLDKLAQAVQAGSTLPGGAPEGGYINDNTLPSPFTRPNPRVGGSMLGVSPSMDRIEGEGRRLPLGSADPTAVRAKLPSGATQPFMPDPSLRQNIGAEVGAHTPTMNMGDSRMPEFSPLRPQTSAALPRSKEYFKAGTDVGYLEPIGDEPESFDSPEEERKEMQRRKPRKNLGAITSALNKLN